MCACNSVFDLDGAMSILNSTERKQSGRESFRNLDDYVSRYCMKCCNKMIEKGDEISIPTTNQVFQKFNIINDETQNSGKDISQNPHVICYYCIDKIKKEDAEENLRKRNSRNTFIINKTHKQIDCKICKFNHKILFKDWNRLNKATCCEGCLIM